MTNKNPAVQEPDACLSDREFAAALAAVIVPPLDLQTVLTTALAKLKILPESSPSKDRVQHSSTPTREMSKIHPITWQKAHKLLAFIQGEKSMPSQRKSASEVEQALGLWLALTKRSHIRGKLQTALSAILLQDHLIAHYLGSAASLGEQHRRAHPLLLRIAKTL